MGVSKRIAIVGGGPGGLFTALLLGQKSLPQLDITLFEADSRLGGKVLTKRFQTVPVLYEAGVAELYQYGQDPLWLLITKLLRLPVVGMAGKTVVFEDRVVRSRQDVVRHFGRQTAHALRQFHRHGSALRPFRAFYNSGWPADNSHPWLGRSMAAILADVPDRTARRYLEMLIHSDMATEPRLTHGLYGLENYLINFHSYCQLYSIEGGIERLIHALRDAISARIRLRAAVRRVEKVSAGYRVFYRREGRNEAEDFDAVALALPNYWLPTLTWGSDSLAAAMARHHEYYNHPAHYLRITALFQRPFWGDFVRGSYFLHDAFGGCCVYDESARHDAGPYGVLGWLLSGGSALALSNHPDGLLIEKVLDSLPDEIAGGRELFLEGHVHRWIGSVNGQPGGKRLQGSKRRHVPEGREYPGLVLVGDYLFDSTINGAFDSADIATDLILDHLRVTRKIVKADYFDYYDGKSTYEDSLKEAFDARYVVKLIRAVWGVAPPYRLLDAGSANGLTLAAFAKLGIDAWGVENSWYIHAKTPCHLQERNLLGDVANLPFPDNAFDFVYETCLAYVPEEQLDRSLQELFRVAKHGVLLGSVARDMNPKLVKKYDLFYGANSVLTLREWSERFLRHGFRLAVTDPKTRAKVWAIEKKESAGEPWYPSAESMTYCFYRKECPLNGTANGDCAPGVAGHKEMPFPEERSRGAR